MKIDWNIIKLALLLAAFVATRIVAAKWPAYWPLNFSAAYALVFCSGAFRRRLPWGLVFGVMLASDIYLNLYHYHTDIFSDYQAVNYLAYAAIFFLGRQFGARAAWLKLVGGGLLGAVLFYFITNTAAWLQNAEYAKTIAGWIQALTVGTPGWPHTWEFFFNTLMSGGLFTGLIAAALKMEPAEAEAEKEPEAEEAAEAEPEKSEA